jgi:hypothetical protein
VPIRAAMRSVEGSSAGYCCGNLSLRPMRVPAFVAAAGECTSMLLLEFFAANIRNPHTRRAYARAAEEFLTTELGGIFRLSEELSNEIRSRPPPFARKPRDRQPGDAGTRSFSVLYPGSDIERSNKAKEPRTTRCNRPRQAILSFRSPVSVVVGMTGAFAASDLAAARQNFRRPDRGSQVRS